MANRYWVGGSGTWNSSNTTNWSTASGGGGGASVPTSADDVFFDAASGTFTVTATSGQSNCKNLDYTGFTGTASGGTISIYGSLVFGTSMVISGSSNPQYDMLATTSQTVTCNGRTIRPIRFNIGGTWTLQDDMNCGSNEVTLGGGTLDTNGKTVTCSNFQASGTNTRSLVLGASIINTSGATGFNASVSTNLTITPGTSTINITGAGFFDATGVSFYDVNFNGTNNNLNGTNNVFHNVNFNGINSVSIAGSNTFNNVTRNGAAVKTETFTLQGDQTINGTLTLNGNSVLNRLYVKSNNFYTKRTITAATVSCSNVDFNNIIGAGAGNWDLSAITGGSGDCGGNSGITFSAPVAQTWSGTSSGNWSTNAWTTRVPLPQDTVSLAKAFSAGQTITVDMPRLGKDISSVGCSGSPTLNNPTGTADCFGGFDLTGFNSITGTSGLNFFANGTVDIKGPASLISTTILFTGQSSDVFNLYINSFASSINVLPSNGNGTINLRDNISCGNFLYSQGTLNTNNFNVTANVFTSLGTLVRAINLGTSTLTATSSGSGWNLTSTNTTLNATSSIIKFTNSSTSTKTFSGGGLSYGTFWNATGNTGTLTISGSNSFQTFKSDVGRTNLFTTGTTQTIANWQASGSSGNLITIDSTTTGTHALTKSGGGTVSADYLSIQHSVASPGTLTWYAGTNSTNNQAVATAGSGWIFTAPPAGGNTSNFLTLF